jgi:Zn-dependent oligopeptidase
MKQLALAQAEAALSTVADPLTFYQSVSPDKDLRDASNEADKLVQDYSIELSMRTDVYHAVQDAAESIARSGEKLSSEEQRLVDKMVLEGKRAGLALPEDKRTQLLDLKKELSQVELDFTVSRFRCHVAPVACSPVTEKLQ